MNESESIKVRVLRRGSLGGGVRRTNRGWLRGILAVAAGAALTVGAVEGARWAKQAPVFAIKSVEVMNTGRASEASVRRLSGVEIGMSLFDVDVDVARGRVLGHPWVAEADVRLVSMDRVRITVVEHEPRALVALGNLYFADAEARLFKRYTPGESVALPVVTGLDRTRVEADDPDQTSWLRSALALIAEWDEQTYGALAEVNVDEARGLTVVLADDGPAVALGRGDWRNRLGRLARVRATLKEKGLRASRIDLSGERRSGRAVVRLAPAMATVALHQTGA